MKVALCFIVNYDNTLNKEGIWRKWIESNRDIINVYIHYNKNIPITSEWVQSHAVPVGYVTSTSYFYVVPAYMSVLHYAYQNDKANTWFCFLTESCVPVISPQAFRRLFFENSRASIFAWRKAWWNVHLVKRANLRLLEEDMRLGHDPWFVLTRDDVRRCISYPITNSGLYTTLCNGGLANESLFAIVLYQNKTLHNSINFPSHITNWDKPSSATSPYVFSTGSADEIGYINEQLHKNRYAMFLRKVSKEFPDEILSQFTCEKDGDNMYFVGWDWAACHLYLYGCLLLASVLIWTCIHI